MYYYYDTQETKESCDNNSKSIFGKRVSRFPLETKNLVYSSVKCKDQFDNKVFFTTFCRNSFAKLQQITAQVCGKYSQKVVPCAVTTVVSHCEK